MAEAFPQQQVECLGPSKDKRIQAQRVFDALRAFDSKDVQQIYAQCPDSQGLGLAVSNRLKKAAGFETIAAGQEKVVLGITGGTGSGKTSALEAIRDGRRGHRLRRRVPRDAGQGRRPAPRH